MPEFSQLHEDISFKIEDYPFCYRRLPNFAAIREKLIDYWRKLPAFYFHILDSVEYSSWFNVQFVLVAIKWTIIVWKIAI